MPNNRKNIFITDKGRKILGEFVRIYRQSIPMNLKDLKYKIIKDTGHIECSVSTLSEFEIGKMRLNPDLLSAISIAMPIPHPSEKRTYSDWELQEIARENLDPKTGLQPAHTE